MYLTYFRGKASSTGIRANRICKEQNNVLAPTAVHQRPKRVQQRVQHMQQRLLGVIAAAQPKQAGSSAAEDTEYDPLRDGPLRFLGYSNEVGEAFGMLVPYQVVMASYAVAISYVLVDTLDKFSRARSGARGTLSLAGSSEGPVINAVTAAAFSNADPADPPHLTKADKEAMASNPFKDISSAPTATSSKVNRRPSVGDMYPEGVRASPQPSPAALTTAVESTSMYSEALPFAGAAEGAGGGVWDSGYGNSATGKSQGSPQINGIKASLNRGLDNAAGMVDAAGVVTGTSGGAGGLGSIGGNAGMAGGGISGKDAQLTREVENAALVVGGLKALDTVVWQMLASVMIPGFIIHQSVRLAAQSLASPTGMKVLNLGASSLGRVIGTDMAAALPGYAVSSLPVALGLALVPIICHPIDNVVDKLLDSTLRPVLRKYRMQLQQEQGKHKHQRNTP